jgi:hypothetical protein
MSSPWKNASWEASSPGTETKARSASRLRFWTVPENLLSAGLPDVFDGLERDEGAYVMPGYDDIDGEVTQSISSVQIYLWSIRDAVRLYQAQTAQITLEELEATWELSEVAVDAPSDMLEVVRMLPRIVNPGLAPFQAKIQLIDPKDENLGLSSPSIYACLCLQLFNHMVEEAVYLRCHNEQCGRLFVRQKGRARQGKYHTTGVMYCSDYCARAQGQRELRRRKGQRNKGKGGGMT